MQHNLPDVTCEKNILRKCLKNHKRLLNGSFHDKSSSEKYSDLSKSVFMKHFIQHTFGKKMLLLERMRHAHQLKISFVQYSKSEK